MLNIAHRGYTRDFPDNTLEAFQAAMQLGVDGIEFDVQETSDAAFIVHHDDDIAGTPIAEMTLADISKIRLPGNYEIPDLQQTLELCDKELVLFIELKQIKSLEKLMQLLRTRANIKKMALISFNLELIERAGKLAPDIMRGVISGSTAAIEQQPMLPGGIKAIGLYFTQLTKEFVERARLNKIMIFVWGCKKTADVQQVMQYDIAGIISDCPDIAKKVLGSA